MEPGIYRDISNEEYHRSPGLSASGLKLLDQSPDHFKNSVREETPAMAIGTALHAAVLEPERFAQEYIELPSLDRRTKAGKEAWAELEASGKKGLKAEDYANVVGMANKVRAHPTAGELITGGEAELSIFWESSTEGVLCKCRPDYLKKVDDHHYNIIDLKKTQDSRPEFFLRTVFKYKYELQASHYFTGCTNMLDLPIGFFVFIAVEEKPPHGVYVYYANQDFLNIGHDRVRRLLKVYHKCITESEWPGYPDEPQELGVPAWAR